MTKSKNMLLHISISLALVLSLAGAASADINENDLRDDIPPSLSAGDLPEDFHPVPVPRGRVRSPVPIPSPRDLRPVVPIPRGHIRPPVPMPKSVKPVVPMPRGDVKPVVPIPTPDELRIAIRPWNFSATDLRCTIQYRNGYRIVRCYSIPRAPMNSAPPAYRLPPAPAFPSTPPTPPAPAPAKPTKKASPAPTSSMCGTADETAAFALLNKARQQNGLSQLRCDPIAIAVARAHSQDMCNRNYFSHQSPEGSAPWHRLKNAGAKFRAAGENIAKGYRSAQAVHDGWMNSPGHRANIVNPNYTRAGIGVFNCNGTNHWTQIFMR